MTPFILALALLAASPAPPQPAPPSLHYVANAGVMVSIGSARFLIDAPIREGIPPYATPDAAERRKLERAQPPYDRIDAILITHWHEDHFSAEAVAAHLAANPRTQLVSSYEVVQRVRAVAPALADRMKGIVPLPGSMQSVTIAGVPVRVLRIAHNPARRVPEQHVGFLLGAGPTVLHTGDADPKAANFTVLRTLPKVDVALLPFWYLQTDANRRFVVESIAPGRIYGMHLPPEDADEVRRQIPVGRVPVTLLVRPGRIEDSPRLVDRQDF